MTCVLRIQPLPLSAKPSDFRQKNRFLIYLRRMTWEDHSFTHALTPLFIYWYLFIHVLFQVLLFVNIYSTNNKCEYTLKYTNYQIWAFPSSKIRVYWERKILIFKKSHKCKISAVISMIKKRHMLLGDFFKRGIWYQKRFRQSIPLKVVNRARQWEKHFQNIALGERPLLRI